MDSYFGIAVIIIVVIIVATGLAVFNNKIEETKSGRNRDRSEKGKAIKAVPKKKKKTNKEKSESASQNKPKRKIPEVKFLYDGEDEDEEQSVLEFLRGTDEFTASQMKEEKKKKARAQSTVDKVRETAQRKADNGDEDVEYVLIKRKKVAEKASTTKKSKKNKEKTGATETAPEDQASGDNVDSQSKKKQKGFFKKGVFQSLRDQATLEKQTDEEEKASKGKKPKKEGEEKTVDVVPAAKEEKKDRPQRPKRNDQEEEITVDADGNTVVGPRQNRPPRKPREDRPPREAPQPPPRPLSGPYEAASLDDMLSAISSHYGPKPKENFAKLPPPVLFRLLRNLSVRDIIVLSKVNRFLNKATRDDRMWRGFCEKDFKLKFSNKVNSKKRFKNIYRDEYLKGKKPTSNNNNTI